jgi:hypothetical protein
VSAVVLTLPGVALPDTIPAPRAMSREMAAARRAGDAMLLLDDLFHDVSQFAATGGRSRPNKRMMQRHRQRIGRMLALLDGE